MRVLGLPGYFILGLVMWAAVLKSGVHATLAGVALAFCIPFDPAPRVAKKAPQDVGAAKRGSPLLKLEHALYPLGGFRYPAHIRICQRRHPADGVVIL